MRKLAVAFGVFLAVAAILIAQQVTPTTQVLPVQVNSAGNPLTLQTWVVDSHTNAASANTCTIAATSGKFIYITGFEVTGAGATGASIITVLLNFAGTTVQSYSLVIPAGATTSITPLIVTFNPPYISPTSGGNCTLTVPSFGAGNTNAAANLHGYYQ